MDVYTVNLGGKYHDDFYKNPKIIAAYKVCQHSINTERLLTHVLLKRFVKAVVSRYKSSPAIFAWELGMCQTTAY